jgi:hypothetical protein
MTLKLSLKMAMGYDQKRFNIRKYVPMSHMQYVYEIYEKTNLLLQYTADILSEKVIRTLE